MSTTISPLAGKPAPKALLVDVPELLAAYADLRPDSTVPAQRVAFGTSGHRGSSFERNFNEWHVLAISQAICEYRENKGIDGPLYIRRAMEGGTPRRGARDSRPLDGRRKVIE